MNTLFLKNKYNKKDLKQGFTLIEALVSIGLILTAVIGPLSLTFNALNTIRQNRSRVIASYLAEETLENFRNYRDSFALSCGILNINYNYTTQQISSIYCASDNNSGDDIPLSYYNSSTPPDTNPQNLAWKIFISATMGDLITNSLSNLYLDNNAFYFNPNNLFNNKLISSADCDYLKYDDNVGYNCAQGYRTQFKRSVNLTKLSGNTLEIEVKVVYLEGSQSERSVSAKDYIYQR